jgi:hypothetical protein
MASPVHRTPPPPPRFHPQEMASTSGVLHAYLGLSGGGGAGAATGGGSAAANSLSSWPPSVTVVRTQALLAAAVATTPFALGYADSLTIHTWDLVAARVVNAAGQAVALESSSLEATAGEMVAVSTGNARAAAIRNSGESTLNAFSPAASGSGTNATRRSLFANAMAPTAWPMTFIR